MLLFCIRSIARNDERGKEKEEGRKGDAPKMGAVWEGGGPRMGEMDDGEGR
jgi:hypothetical protein